MRQLEGKLLVALPMLADPNFDRTVILLLSHSEGGAVGVVLNRPSTIGVGEPLAQWEDLAAEPSVVFVGGPVRPEVAIGLGRGTVDVGNGWSRLHGEVGTVDLDADARLVPVEAVRVFAGYAGWSGGQLEDEIGEGAWIILDAHTDDAFTGDPDDLWHTVLRRQPGKLRWLANLPVDVSVN